MLMFKVTNEWINANRTANGGWTNAQWEAIGATSKLRRQSGWKDLLIGGYITEAQKLAFEQAANTYSKRGRNHHKRETTTEVVDRVLAEFQDKVSMTDSENDAVEYFAARLVSELKVAKLEK